MKKLKDFYHEVITRTALTSEHLKAFWDQRLNYHSIDRSDLMDILASLLISLPKVEQTAFLSRVLESLDYQFIPKLIHLFPNHGRAALEQLCGDVTAGVDGAPSALLSLCNSDLPLKFQKYMLNHGLVFVRDGHEQFGLEFLNEIVHVCAPRSQFSPAFLRQLIACIN
jgi:hypothetical protein